MPPASRITDLHTCPAHGGGPVVTGSSNTIIGYMPAARVTDKMVCGPVFDVIRKGSGNVLINHLQAARLGDPTVHAGVLVTGDPTVLIGETPQSYTLFAASASGAPFCEECERLKREQEAEAARQAELERAPSESDAENAHGEAETTATPPPPPPNPYETTPEERGLASAPGNAPDQRAAREKVVREFYDAFAQDGLGQLRADQDLGVGGSPPRANGSPAGFGIDLGLPVQVVTFPPPEQVAMFVRSGGAAAGFFGNFIDPSQPPGSQTGAQLGLNDDPAHRKQVILDLPPGGGVALQSGNGPILDDWTDAKNPVQTPGGGTQWTVPNTVKEGVACTGCGSPPDLTSTRWVAVGSPKNKVPPRRCVC